MANLLTFLGKGGVGRTTVAIAAAYRLAQQGQRVLLVGQASGPGLGLLLGTALSGGAVQAVPAGFDAVQLAVPQLLEQGWEQLKQLETQYVRTPFFKNVYGQELAILPGLDSALVLNAVREFERSDRYDQIILDGSGDLSLLRMLGMPEVLSWYVRRFSQVLGDSDLGRSLAPFVGPVSAAVLTTSVSGETLPLQQAQHLMEQGIAAIADPARTRAYLVTTADPVAIATAQYLWGAAQQVGLSVAGVWLNQLEAGQVSLPEAAKVSDGFAPLPLARLPRVNAALELAAHLPDWQTDPVPPEAIAIDVASRTVSLFLPGLDKKQVKLTQYGPELTIEAGDHRRNLRLPDGLRGQPVTAARFQNGYLIISF